MDALVNTTYYLAILLRKRWQETLASSRDAFDLEEELERIQAEAPLTSVEVSALERWAAGGAAAPPERGLPSSHERILPDTAGAAAPAP